MPDLKRRLIGWSESIAEANGVNIWIAGGGRFVDQVRHWQTLHGLNEETAHRISIGLMSQTAEIFSSLFPDWPLLSDVQQLESVQSIGSPNVVFDCRRWALHNSALERSWQTTSDTIALKLATAINASGLFLLKSKSPTSGNINVAIEEGLIDQNFIADLNASSPLKASITNLRKSNDAIELRW